MGLTNLRRQHAVGQGFFHSGELHEDAALRLRYVYDCGAMTKYAGPRSERIKAYVRSARARSLLDLLFISHVHADHLNGLPQLLHAKTGLRVDTIVLPYFNMIDRLIGYARDATEDPATMRDTFYRDFVISPVAALSGFGPRQILFVRPTGDDSPGAPGLDGGPDGGLGISGLRTEEGAGWKLVGPGAVEGRESDGGQSPVSGAVVATIPDSVGIALPGSGFSKGSWLFSPFIDPAIKRQRSVFKASLLRALNYGKLTRGKIKRAEFDAWLDDPANLKDLVLNRVSDLRIAYAAVQRDLNISSMCLYSGPLPDGNSHLRQNNFVRFGDWTGRGEGRIGWLGTGDAHLKAKSRRTAFLRHYRNLLDEVLTLTVPHHGSDSNFDPELLKRVNPYFCVAAADAVGTWRHPGTAVVQAIASHGRFLSVVTSQLSSEVVERVAIN